MKLRPPHKMMRLERLGSFHQCRLSFMRQLTRRMARENWQFERSVFDINAQGEGVAVYRAKTPHRTYSLVAFAHDLPAEKRSDRVIADAWDTTFTLFDGIPDKADLERLAQNVPKQEAGRISEKELSLSRANRSVRLWDQVVDHLAKGIQPPVDALLEVGYLMRTTAVYGSGKFGAADRAMLKDRSELQAPFQVEMLSVYLTRTFVRDLVNYMAKLRGGDAAVELDEQRQRMLGIGNSTGLGMAPFLINHPSLLHHWIAARETAIAKVCDQEQASPDAIEKFLQYLNRAQAALDFWQSDHPLQIKKIAQLKQDAALVAQEITKPFLNQSYPWQALMDWAEDYLSHEGQEWIASLLIEPFGELVDALGTSMAEAESYFILDGAMLLDAFRRLIEQRYDWALTLDWTNPNERARVWYISEEKLEPRLGERFDEPLQDYEQPLGTAYDAMQALHVIKDWPDQTPLAEFLESHPEFRRIAYRVQRHADEAYSELYDNTLSTDMLPIDMLRAKLSFFGATAFDPRSDRWVRITMYQGAPYPETLCDANADDWIYPEC